MWNAKVYPLAFLIIAFSGIWPYAKLLMMLVCWFAPTKYLSPLRRHKLLDFLDAYGKWSLVDTFVLVLFMVAFKFKLELLSGTPWQDELQKELGVGDGLFFLYV